MKNGKYLFSAMVLTSLIILAGCGGGGGSSSPPPFSQADLTGNWYISILQANPTLSGSSEPGWIRGTATVSSSGTISAPNMETNMGSGSGPADVVWTIDPWTGVISETGASGNPDFHGKLAANKQLIVGTATNLNSVATGTTAQLRIMQKIYTSATYTISDIANTTFMVHQIESGGGNEWMWAEGDTGPISGASTTVTLFTVTKPSGTSLGGSPGQLSINASGLVSLDTNSSFQGMVSPDKTYMIATETSLDDSSVYRLSVIQFKKTTTYSLSDLTGTWSHHSIVSAGRWLYGTPSIDSNGYGTMPLQYDSEAPPTPVLFSLEMTGQGVFSDPLNPTSHSFLSSTRDLLVMTQTLLDPVGGSMMAIMVK